MNGVHETSGMNHVMKNCNMSEMHERNGAKTIEKPQDKVALPQKNELPKLQNSIVGNKLDILV